MGPLGGQVPCSACGAAVDPLRAGHVAIFNARFHYFCNYHRCRARFVGETPGDRPPAAPGPPRVPDPEPRELEIARTVMTPVQGAEATPPPDDAVPEMLRVDDSAGFLEPLQAPAAAPGEADAVPLERRELGSLLLALATIAGVLTVALDFAASTQLVLIARTVLVAVGVGALGGRALTSAADAAEIHRLPAVLPAVLAAALAVWGLLTGEPALAARASFFAGTVVTVSALTVWLIAVASRPVASVRHWLEQRLDVPAHRVVAEDTAIARESASSMRPGERVVVEAGETVPVDVEIVEGEAELQPWIGARQRVRRRPGDFVVAGAQLTQGQLRGVCTWVGTDRAMARPLVAPERRCDVHAQLPRLGRSLAQRWSWVAAAVATAIAVVLTWGHGHPIEVAMVGVAVATALCNGAIGTVASLAVARGVRAALGRGIVYNSAGAWDRCARISAAVFCARGTVLRGEPELAEVEVFGDRAEADEVLSVAAGAVAVERQPMAIAIRRAARARKLTPDAVRNPRSLPSLGVTAVASTGEAVCVGNRTLMVQRHISVAVAEQRAAELESMGRTVTLVSRGGHLLGLLALHDGLRTGARAAVQQLVDANVEPVLMSADSRETCEALGRSLDIEHIRPEIAEADRAQAVERLRDTGATVAVIGHSPFDDPALKAADASVALAAAGRTPDDFSASLASDDVRDAAAALAIAHRTQRQSTQVLGLALAPAAFGALVVAAGLLPPEYAPLALLLGAGAATLHLRSWDRALERRS